MDNELEPRKKLIFSIVTAALVVIVPLLVVIGYFGFRKLTFSYDYCGSYGEFDSELGWRLKANASSCLSLKNKLSGKVFFDSKIYTDRMGFRASGRNQSTPAGAIVTIGDSWTFGYGVDYEQSYPYFLSSLSGVPVVNMGVPAYGSGNTLLLFRRNVHALRPKVVIYLSKGLWQRSLCSGQNAAMTTLVPCFLTRADGTVELTSPRPGVVESAVRRHDYPGGSLTAGYDSFWTYLFIVKPKELLGLTHKLAADSAAPDVLSAIFKYELNTYLQLAKDEHFKFVLVDPSNYYRPVAQGLERDDFVYIGGSEQWQKNVEDKIARLAPERAYVPGDGHYGQDANRLIAGEIYRVLQARGVLQ
jgi:hypothetical protein